MDRNDAYILLKSVLQRAEKGKSVRLSPLELQAFEQLLRGIRPKEGRR